MSNPIEAKLAALGFTLPTPALAIANYLPFVVIDNLVFISGQIPSIEGVVQYQGLVTDDNISTAAKAAQIATLNILAQLKQACDNDLARVVRCVRLGGFIACDASFHRPSEVMNFASEIMVQLWGDAGRHARTAIGCTALPQNAMIEIEAVFAL